MPSSCSLGISNRKSRSYRRSWSTFDFHNNQITSIFEFEKKKYTWNPHSSSRSIVAHNPAWTLKALSHNNLPASLFAKKKQTVLTNLLTRKRVVHQSKSSSNDSMTIPILCTKKHPWDSISASRKLNQATIKALYSRSRNRMICLQVRRKARKALAGRSSTIMSYRTSSSQVCSTSWNKLRSTRSKRVSRASCRSRICRKRSRLNEGKSLNRLSSEARIRALSPHCSNRTKRTWTQATKLKESLRSLRSRPWKRGTAKTLSRNSAALSRNSSTSRTGKLIRSTPTRHFRSKSSLWSRMARGKEK